MQFVEIRDRFLDAYLALEDPRRDVWRRDVLSSLADGTGIHVAEVEELVCNWVLQIAMWHRQPGFLWIDPRYEIRPGDEGYEHHRGALLRFGKTQAMRASTESPRLWLLEIAVNRDRNLIRTPDSERPAGISQWTSTVSAREILGAEYPLTSCSNSTAHGIATVRLRRGWSVDYSPEIELVT